MSGMHFDWPKDEPRGPIAGKQRRENPHPPVYAMTPKSTRKRHTHTHAYTTQRAPQIKKNTRKDEDYLYMEDFQNTSTNKQDRRHQQAAANFNNADHDENKTHPGAASHETQQSHVHGALRETPQRLSALHEVIHRTPDLKGPDKRKGGRSADREGGGGATVRSQTRNPLCLRTRKKKLDRLFSTQGCCICVLLRSRRHEFCSLLGTNQRTRTQDIGVRSACFLDVEKREIAARCTTGASNGAT